MGVLRKCAAWEFFISHDDGLSSECQYYHLTFSRGSKTLKSCTAILMIYPGIMKNMNKRV